MAALSDLTGRVFGDLTVVRLLDRNRGRPKWVCRCACGNEKVSSANSLRCGNTRSCGCWLSRTRHPKHDLSGARFGMLVVRSFAGMRRVGSKSTAWWLCSCDCGATHEVRAETLLNGGSRSCGCRARTAASRHARHGMSGTRVHRIWKGMVDRCRNGNNKAYDRYGGRGIYVCDRWLMFENFLEDMGEPPAGHMIERVDNEGPYSLDNCVLATPKVQARNKRNNRVITIGSESLSLAAWCERYGVSYHLVKDRLRWGWDPLTALTAPPRPMRRCG